MNHIEEHLQKAREHYKENIVRLVTLIYIHHNGNFPNWEEDEEISVEDSEIGRTSRISVKVNFASCESIEQWTIEEYHINVNGDLYFWCNDTLEEIEWSNVATDELVSIFTNLYNYWEKVKVNESK